MLGNIWKAHDSSPWQNNFINGIQIHNQSPGFKPTTIHSSKAQFSLATSKPNSYWQHQSPIFISTTLSKRKEPKIIKHLAKEKNISCYRSKKKDHGNHLIKKLIESYLEDYVLKL